MKLSLFNVHCKGTTDLFLIFNPIVHEKKKTCYFILLLFVYYVRERLLLKRKKMYTSVFNFA